MRKFWWIPVLVIVLAACGTTNFTPSSTMLSPAAPSSTAIRLPEEPQTCLVTYIAEYTPPGIPSSAAGGTGMGGKSAPTPTPVESVWLSGSFEMDHCPTTTELLTIIWQHHALDPNGTLILHEFTVQPSGGQALVQY